MRSLGIFLGRGTCDAACAHCSGLQFRNLAPTYDLLTHELPVRKAIIEAHGKGARSISLTGSGEPTQSPVSIEAALSIIQDISRLGFSYNIINLYTNGIRIGNDDVFALYTLPLYFKLGLTRVTLTVHNIDEMKNALAYGVSTYPSIKRVVQKILRANISVRASIVLSKRTVATCDQFIQTVSLLQEYGVKEVAVRPVRASCGAPDTSIGLPDEELSRIEDWVAANGLSRRIQLKFSKEIYDDQHKIILLHDGSRLRPWSS